MNSGRTGVGDRAQGRMGAWDVPETGVKGFSNKGVKGCSNKGVKGGPRKGGKACATRGGTGRLRNRRAEDNDDVANSTTTNVHSALSN